MTSLAEQLKIEYTLPEIHKASDTFILKLIDKLQTIQKTQPSTHTDTWEFASILLAPLFAEMARRSS